MVRHGKGGGKVVTSRMARFRSRFWWKGDLLGEQVMGQIHACLRVRCKVTARSHFADVNLWYVRLKLAFCMTCAVQVPVLAQRLSF